MTDECEALEQQGRILEDENARLQRTLAMANQLAGGKDDDEEEEEGSELDEDGTFEAEDGEDGQPLDVQGGWRAADGGEVLEDDYRYHLKAQEFAAAQANEIVTEIDRHALVRQLNEGHEEHVREGQRDEQHLTYYEVPESPYPHAISPSSYTAPGAASGLTVAMDPELASKALVLNLQYQDLLRRQMHNIEVACMRNADFQKRIKALIIHSQKKTARKPGKRSFTAPYFSTISGELPPDNPDAIKRKFYLKSMPSGFKFKKWNDQEKSSLRNAVRVSNIKLLNRRRYQQRGNNKTLRQLDSETEKIKNAPQTEMEMNLEGLDWAEIARVFVPSRSGMDCRIQWTQNMWPGIDCQKKFTKEEDQRLLALAAEHKGHNWVSIAAELGTNRTPAQCFQRYQRSLNTNIMRGRWTKEEDMQLVEAVRNYGQKNWQQVAHCLQDRTGQQCLHRWQKTLNPEIRRGRWTAKEDMMLVLAVKAYTTQDPKNFPWVKIQMHVPGRTDVQCRERWVNILDPSINAGPWTEEEDEKLKAAIAKHGKGKWSLIAQHLPRRTDNQCWRRWKALNAGEVESYRKIVHKKKKGLVNNFVGREKERPELTIADFELEDESQPQNQQALLATSPLPTSVWPIAQLQPDLASSLTSTCSSPQVAQSPTQSTNPAYLPSTALSTATATLMSSPSTTSGAEASSNAYSASTDGPSSTRSGRKRKAPAKANASPASKKRGRGPKSDPPADASSTDGVEPPRKRASRKSDKAPSAKSRKTTPTPDASASIRSRRKRKAVGANT